MFTGVWKLCLFLKPKKERSLQSTSSLHENSFCCFGQWHFITQAVNLITDLIIICIYSYFFIFMSTCAACHLFMHYGVVVFYLWSVVFWRCTCMHYNLCSLLQTIRGCFLFLPSPPPPPPTCHYTGFTAASEMYTDCSYGLLCAQVFYCWLASLCMALSSTRWWRTRWACLEPPVLPSAPSPRMSRKIRILATALHWKLFLQCCSSSPAS